MKKTLSLILVLALSIQITACKAEASPVKQAESPMTVESSPTASLVENSEFFSERDFETEFNSENAVEIKLNGSSAEFESAAVEYKDNQLKISDEGTYILRGKLSEGMVIVDAEKSDKIELVLDGVEINSADCAAIYVFQADKLFINLAEGSENTLSNGGSFSQLDDNNIDAVIYSKDDVTLKGSGSLSISSPAGHGVVSKDSLSITDGEYYVNCASNGLDANDDVSIAGGSFEIVSGKDAIKAENDEDESACIVYISGGDFELSSEGDGISASGSMQIDGGSFSIVSGGGHENAAEKSSGMWGQFMPAGIRPDRAEMDEGKQDDRKLEDMTPPERPDGEIPNRPGNMMPGDMEGFERPEMPAGGFGAFEPVQDKQLNGDGSSMKAFKAKGELTINGGSFNADSADDAFHSDLNMNINAGTFEIAAGDDAFHAEEQLVINGGSINISQSYEGIEALHVSIFGGDIELEASDDGINAAGGVDQSGFGGRDRMFGGAMEHNSGGSILIGGGNLNITAYGDGLDANGSIEITGGSTVVCGPTYGDTSILDYYTTASISGGSFVGSGSAMMSQSFSDYSQGLVFGRLSSEKSAGTRVDVQNSKGETIMNFSPELDFELVIVSSPELSVDETYSLSIETE